MKTYEYHRIGKIEEQLEKAGINQQIIEEIM
jgi:hypothetical protein